MNKAADDATTTDTPRQPTPRRAHSVSKSKHSGRRVVFLSLRVGDVVDIGKRWVAVLSCDDSQTVTLISSNGDKARILSEGIETKMAPRVWITRVPGTATSGLRLRFEGPKGVSIKHRSEPALQTLAAARREMSAVRFCLTIRRQSAKISKR